MTFPETIADIVSNVRAEYDPGDGKRPFYAYGHPTEIFNTLSEKIRHSTFKADKYPLITLFLDIEEDVSNRGTVHRDVVFAIITQTDPVVKVNNRYDTNFVPILIPLYELFIKHIKSSKYLLSDQKYKHTKRDRPYWGQGDFFGTGKRIGNDALDAIIISNINLISKNCI